MTLDRRLLRLVVITDGASRTAADLLSRARAAARGGATLLQLRLKDVADRDVVALARRLVADSPVPVIVNDRFDLALAAGAAGVHVGTDDVSVADVRRCVPAGFIVGASVGCAAEVANAVGGGGGADYVGIGPVYATATKGDAGAAIGVAGFARLRRLTGLPAVGIGGITAATAREVIAAGADGVAVVSAVFGARDPEAAARALCRAIGS